MHRMGRSRVLHGRVACEYGPQVVVAAKPLDVGQPHLLFARQLESVTAHEARVTLVNLREDDAHEPVERVEVAGDPPARLAGAQLRRFGGAHSSTAVMTA